MARLLARLVALNDGWARPFGEFNRRWAAALFRPMTPIRDLLNGRWLGHPLHAAVTDIPIGLLLGRRHPRSARPAAAADIALVATIVFMVAVGRCPGWPTTARPRAPPSRARPCTRR